MSYFSGELRKVILCCGGLGMSRTNERRLTIQVSRVLDVMLRAITNGDIGIKDHGVRSGFKSVTFRKEYLNRRASTNQFNEA